MQTKCKRLYKTANSSHIDCESTSGDNVAIDENFSVDSRMKRNNTKATTTSTSQQYQCSECGKCFEWQHRLKRHLLIHSNENRFECFLCQER